jgi:hypothetical protein
MTANTDSLVHVLIALQSTFHCNYNLCNVKDYYKNNVLLIHVLIFKRTFCPKSELSKLSHLLVRNSVLFMTKEK